VEYQFVPNLWPPNSSYEQTNIFLYACAAATIAAVIFSKGAPYRKPLYTNGRNCSESKLLVMKRRGASFSPI
jgi:hypothetical protein